MVDIYLREAEGNLSEAAHALLEELLSEKYSVPVVERKTLPDGKPYLDNGPQFNISHTHGAVVIAIGDESLGVDVERVRDYPERLPRRIFSPLEFEWFEARGSMKKDFFTLWTLKESYYKMLGTGLLGFPNGTEFTFRNRQWKLTDSTAHFWVREEKSLLISLCTDEQTIVNFHRI